MADNITCIILAGGKSSRMGRDKSFLRFSGKPLIEALIYKLSPIFKDLLIVTDRPRAYERYGIKICTDILKGRGPLGGIWTGLVSSGTAYNFITACDMPFVNRRIAEYMLTQINGCDVVVAKRHKRLHPLYAVYSKNCIRPIENQIRKDNLKITDFFEFVRVRVLTEREVAKLDPEGNTFVNINTPQDYQSIML